jgi:hypothetical protein
MYVISKSMQWSPFEKLPVALLVKVFHVLYRTREYIINSRIYPEQVISSIPDSHDIFFFQTQFMHRSSKRFLPFQFSDYSLDGSIFTRQSQFDIPKDSVCQRYLIRAVYKA